MVYTTLVKYQTNICSDNVSGPDYAADAAHPSFCFDMKNKSQPTTPPPPLHSGTLRAAYEDQDVDPDRQPHLKSAELEACQFLQQLRSVARGTPKPAEASKPPTPHSPIP